MKINQTKSILFTLAITAVAFAFTAFVPVPAKQKFVVDTQASTLHWVGKKVTGQHSGTVGVSSGELTAEGKAITSGKFSIDLAAIKVTDITDTDSKAKLTGHLKSDDFFATEKYPKADFVLSSATPSTEGNYLVKGKLTIKGITNDIEFPAAITVGEKQLVATAKILVDRTKYDIKFRSTNFFENLGDKAIDNNFELDLKLVANQQKGA